MSRTYRKHLEWDWYAHGRFWKWDEVKALPIDDTLGWSCISHFVKSRDKKPWDKPGRSFKRSRRQQERARAAMAVRTWQDPPRIRKSDVWDWN